MVRKRIQFQIVNPSLEKACDPSRICVSSKHSDHFKTICKLWKPYIAKNKVLSYRHRHTKTRIESSKASIRKHLQPTNPTIFKTQWVYPVCPMCGTLQPFSSSFFNSRQAPDTPRTSMPCRKPSGSVLEPLSPRVSCRSRTLTCPRNLQPTQ